MMNPMIRIFKTQVSSGKVFKMTIDLNSYCNLSSRKFFIRATKVRTGCIPFYYAYISSKEDYNKKIRVHREVMGNPESIIDHINHDSLDNRLSNLRACSRSQNTQNSTKRFKCRNKTGYKGVLSRNKEKFYAMITYNKNPIYLGTYPTAYQAAGAYDQAAIKYFGEFALTNFPREEYL